MVIILLPNAEKGFHQKPLRPHKTAKTIRKRTVFAEVDDGVVTMAAGADLTSDERPNDPQRDEDRESLHEPHGSRLLSSRCMVAVVESQRSADYPVASATAASAAAG